MKALFLIFALIIVTGFYSAQTSDTIGTKPRRFMLSATFFETGAMIPFKEKNVRDLPYGMNGYVGDPRTAFVISAPGIGVFYKEKFGVEVLFLRSTALRNDLQLYNEELNKMFPDYYVRRLSQDNITLNRSAFRFAYRLNFRHFQLTPKLHIGFSKYNKSTSDFTLKQMGSNHFIEYNIDAENLRKKIVDYGLLVEFTRSIKQKQNLSGSFEYGIRTGFTVIPTRMRYTLTQKPYDQPSISQVLDLKQNRPYITAEIMLRYYWKW